MKKLLALAAAAMFATGVAYAQDKANPQQEKMKACNAEAGKKNLKGDARQKFMSECLSAASVTSSQQEKMKSCNAEAGKKNLTGDARQKFMSECLKG
jgi:opacity protein-like surface antigen